MKVTSTEIKNGFGKYLRLCSTEPIYITKNGKTIAKLLNHSEQDDIIEESVNLRKVLTLMRDITGIISLRGLRKPWRHMIWTGSG